MEAQRLSLTEKEILMYDDVLGIATTGSAGTGAVLAQTGGDVGQLLVLAWGLALVGTAAIATASKLRARKQQ
jgi:hypothetical protein